MAYGDTTSRLDSELAVGRVVHCKFPGKTGICDKSRISDRVKSGVKVPRQKWVVCSPLKIDSEQG